MTLVHPLAVVDSAARLGDGVRVGPFAVIGAGVEIGDGTEVGAGAKVLVPARIGRENRIYPNAAIGFDPQDLKFQGEEVWLEIGDRNHFREFCTVHRGTAKGGGVTRVGSDSLFMAYTHIGHDSQIGNGCILANSATLAGHVIVEDFAVVGALCPVHQFCRIGRYAYIGACTVITQDVPPFSRVVTERETRCYGVNSIGLSRHGFSRERLDAIERAYRLLLRSKLNTSQAVEQMRADLDGSADVAELIAFIESAERGLTK